MFSPRDWRIDIAKTTSPGKVNKARLVQSVHVYKWTKPIPPAAHISLSELSASPRAPPPFLISRTAKLMHSSCNNQL